MDSACIPANCRVTHTSVTLLGQHSQANSAEPVNAASGARLILHLKVEMSSRVLSWCLYVGFQTRVEVCLPGFVQHGRHRAETWIAMRCDVEKQVENNSLSFSHLRDHRVFNIVCANRETGRVRHTRTIAHQKSAVTLTLQGFTSPFDGN